MWNNTKNLIFKILKKTEKYTKTDMIYLVKGGSWLGIGQVVSMSIALLTSIVFANLLDPELYGNYKYILSITALLSLSTLSGMDSAITQSVAKGFEGTLDLGVKTKIKWGFLGSITSLFIALYYYTQGNIGLALGFCIVSIFVPFSESFDMYNSLLMGKKLFDVQTKYNIVRKVISLFVIIGTLFYTKNILIILSAYFLTLTIPAGIFLYKTLKKYISNRDSDPEAIRYGKHLSAIYIIGIALGELDKILVFHYLGAINLAVYAIAVAPSDQIKGLLKNLNSLAMPQFSNRTTEEIRETIWHKILILTLTTGFIVLIYIILAPIFFNLFFPKYLESVHYSQILAVSLIPIVLAGFIYVILESQKAKKELYQYNLYSNILNIIIIIPLIYYFGIWGAVASRLIVRSFTFALASILLNRAS